ncbi:neuropeptide-like protein C4orf48 homolog isoform X1 [Marmota monax]|uniref:neuropeptide-like protein C4orf48 homolog isoform X1 n=1 Tax=Marmota monax TaxID=9995 RepID=UPI001EB0777A|nr:neuropeptide-like protein C4orf48 homolog isoform X1 [Marmota monax]XP_046279861.1 neuropeptide-like protein C4orf48 homolog isoform X1 [Marmota monax]
MAPPPACRSLLSPLSLLLLLLSLALLGARAEPAAGSVVPAQSRPCVDCHAFEFMQRALQDLRKTARSLDAREEEFLEVERRGDPPPTSPGAFSCTSAEGPLEAQRAPHPSPELDSWKELSPPLGATVGDRDPPAAGRAPSPVCLLASWALKTLCQS